MVGRLTPWSARRWVAGAGLVLTVFAVHWGVVDQLVEQAAAFELTPTTPPRMEVAYVREMALQAPPTVAPQRRPLPKALAQAATRAGAPAVPAASAPEPAASAPALEPAPPEPPSLAEATLEPPLMTRTPEVAAPLQPAASSSAQPFEWPGSTRLRYILTGNYRGDVHGQAQVEWIREGNHYQVHVDVAVGPKIAPLFSRSMSSDGLITEQGLSPRRYDQETKIAFAQPIRAVMHFDAQQIQLSNGFFIPTAPGVQDTSSQFVQIAWLFAMQPERLQAGGTVEIPLAMPRNLRLWTYDVVEPETLHTPFGEVQAFYLKPRRVTQAGGDLTVGIWIAPQLRYLPVRFRINQDAETYLDLILERRPELAAP